MLLAKLAVLTHFQPIFKRFLIFAGKVIGLLANCAFHFDHVVLGHIGI
jgi:hypothetical protein